MNWSTIKSEFEIKITDSTAEILHQRSLEVDDMVSDSINNILYQLERYVTSRPLVNNEITEKYLELLLLYLKDPISRKSDMGMSNKEKNLFCAFTGIHANQHIRQRLIAESKIKINRINHLERKAKIGN